MGPKTTAWFLAITTLAGPSICCCSFTKVASWASACLGYGFVSCSSTACSHDHADAHGHSHGAEKHDDSHGHKGQVPVAGLSTQEDDRQHLPEQCPCPHDRMEPAALPITTELAGTAPLDLSWLTFTLDHAAQGPANLEKDARATRYCPAGVCLDGRGILRAYSVLRI